ncbi:MAG: HAMP domain-containing protein [Spirochaetes bacterium]|nr:HAMP domain-containing protein [Spirochaetota bacterium]MBN2769489.1 HAMP domain-containing protein [Spirochaetota bacterium]
MRKPLRVILILLASLSVVLFLLIYQADQIITRPLDKTEEIKYPSYVIADSLGDIYCIDDSLRRIIKTNRNGEISYIINGGSRNDNSFYNAVALITDNKQNLYVLTRTLDDQGFYVTRERLIKYNALGEFDSVIFETDYSSVERVSQLVQRGRLTGLGSFDEKIRWFEIEAHSVNQYQYDSDTGELDFSRIMAFKNAQIFISYITRLKSGEYVYSTKKGHIAVHDESKKNQDDRFAFVRSAELKGAVSKEDILINSAGDPVIYSGDNHIAGGMPSVPWYVTAGDNNKIYYSDLTTGSVSRLSYDGTVKEILTNDLLKNEGVPDAESIVYTFYVDNSGTVYTALKNSIVAISPNGKTDVVLQSLKRPSQAVISSSVFQLLFLAAILVSIVFIIRFYTVVMNRRVSIILKQIGIFIPLTVIALLITAKTVFDNMSERYQQELTNRLSLMVQLMTQAVDTRYFNDINNQSDFMNDAYSQVRERFHSLLNENRDEWNNGYYFALHRVVKGRIYSMMFLNDGISMFHPFDYLNEPGGVYIRALRGEIAAEKAADAWGLWMDAVGPIYSDEGSVVALLEVGKDYTNYAQENARLFRRVLINVMIISIIFMMLFATLFYLMLTSIRNLRNGATMIAEGKLEIDIKAKGNDEVADLTISFNNMARAIKKHVSEIVALNTAYFRFVPEQFLTFLNKESVIDVKLGDQIQAEMSVMFTDIRSFTQMSEKMSPKENFDFLNTYLSVVGPVVRENNGFIDKYIGDAIMALFPQSADDAVQTAIGILKKLHSFNRDLTGEKKEQIAVGFGIHTGLLMLGILGEEQRVDSTVISDNVNLASRLEGLTKKFGASIIISGTTYQALQNRELVLTRYLGRIQVKGKNSATDIYEVLDGLTEEEKVLRIKNREHLETAIEAILAKDLLAARKSLSIAYRINKVDKAVIYYLKLVKSFEKNPELMSSSGIIMKDK